ncbi:class I SAM-dependent methyltransferase [Mesorhizobium sp. NZP2077]|uniref:class I SAM-dependent methyltransferase n=1 Tax=Mesorhizobium sp. NZP2077 TaxID=2483404 RepID=UPI00155497BF|nr:class I SAM-dependent methyltransferase [Mesorhizobium sp. NZP2077]QKC82051.1 class I SAM-dependent methyltransferase [Mesorhizobium sp. NZP2077]QKD15522.1 class I SAM-dependent methyltransferase [Mesorhizobium sp. NZP2077]
MLDESAQEPLAIPLAPQADRFGGNDGLAFQGAAGLHPEPPRASVVGSLDGIGAIGLHDFIAQQFSMPEGMCGRAAGAVMGLINHLPNRRAIERLDIGEQDDVLEIGFGPGWALKKMARLAHGGTITGVDRSPTMVRQAQIRNRAAIQDGKLKLIHGTFERLPVESASMDKILAVNVIYFCSPTGTALAEAHRVLRPGGTMSIYATDCSSMKRLQFVGPETRQTFDPKGLEDFLGRSAFASDQIDIQVIWLPFGFRGLVARLCKR